MASVTLCIAAQHVVFAHAMTLSSLVNALTMSRKKKKTQNTLKFRVYRHSLCHNFLKENMVT